AAATEKNDFAVRQGSFFNVFAHDANRFIGRSWLNDPADTEERSSTGSRPEWTGYYFVNTGISHDDDARAWELNRRYHFVNTGGGSRWINAIKKLKKGNKFFAYI